MNKKAYIQPDLTVVKCQTMALFCASGVKSEEKDIEYGGIDEDGTMVPGTRRRHDVWENEEFEEEEEF